MTTKMTTKTTIKKINKPKLRTYRWKVWGSLDINKFLSPVPYQLLVNVKKQGERDEFINK